MVTDSDALIREMHGDLKVLRADVTTIRSDVLETKRHAAATNGQVADIATEQIKQAAVISTLRIIISLGLGVMGLGVAVAGTILTVVLKLHG